jgi:hypothetical protein
MVIRSLVVRRRVELEPGGELVAKCAGVGVGNAQLRGPTSMTCRFGWMAEELQEPLDGEVRARLDLAQALPWDAGELRELARASGDVEYEPGEAGRESRRE